MPPIEVLDAALRQRSGSVDDFGPDACNPDQPFGALIAEAFDNIMTPAEWAGMLNDPKAPAQQRVDLLKVWREQVLARFASRYGLRGA